MQCEPGRECPSPCAASARVCMQATGILLTGAKAPRVKRIHGMVIALAVASCIWPTAAKTADSQPHAATTPKTKSSAASATKTVSSREAARRAALMQLAPADEYFGPLKQSILGIRNTIRDMGLRYDVNHDIGSRTLTSAGLTEAAIRDWAHRYPRDHEVPSAILNLQRLYAKILTEPARGKAKATADWLFSAYGNSPQAKSLRKILASEQLPPISTLSASASPSPSPAAVATPPYDSLLGPPAPPIFAPTPAPIVPGASPTPH